MLKAMRGIRMEFSLSVEIVKSLVHNDRLLREGLGCDQIWRNCATLAKVYKSLANF